jgi:hypothetical protein
MPGRKAAIAIAIALVIVASVIAVGINALIAGPPPPDVDIQIFQPAQAAINVGDKFTLQFNAVNNDARSYANVVARISSDNPDAEKYLIFNKNDIVMNALGPAHSATHDVHTDINAKDGVVGNALKFPIKVTLFVEGIQTDQRTVDVTINPK